MEIDRSEAIVRRLAYAGWQRRGLRAALVVGLAAVVATGANAVGGITPARAAAVLAIAQTVSGNAVVGQNLTFIVTMTNSGDQSIVEGVDDAVPSFVKIVSLKSTGITCGRVAGGALLICNPLTLTPGASVSYALTVQPTEAGNLSNLAEGDPAFLTSAVATVDVAPAPTDVQITGFASTGSPNRGATFSYTFQVKDNGPWSVDDVTFSDALPAQVSVVGATTDNGSACSQTASTVSCDLGGLNVGQQVQVVITVVAPSAPSTFTNTAAVTPDVSDTQPANNSVGVTVQVK